MGKIDQRRAKTAKANIDNKAVLADGTAPKSEFPYKKILIAVLAVVAVIACALLILNAVIDNYSGKFRTEKAVAVNDATVDFGKITDADTLYKDANAELNKYGFLVPVVNDAYANYAKQAGKAMSNEKILNFVVTVNGDVYGEDSNNKLATIMLLSINDKKITFVRMNTSTFVSIPGLSAGPLYDSYRFGGAALVAKTIQENFGVAINGYFDLPLEAFVEAAILFEEDGEINLPKENPKQGESTTVAFPIVTDSAATAKTLFDYVKSCDNKEAMVQELIKVVAGNFSKANLLDLRKLVDDKKDKEAPFGAESGIVSYVSRGDFATLLNMGTSILSGDKFNAKENVITFGFGEEATYVDYNGAAGEKYFATSALVNAGASVEKLQAALGYIESK